MKKQQKAEPKALKVTWDVRNYSDGIVTTHEAIMCPDHRNRLFSSVPNARGNGQYVPVEHCDLCTGRKHFIGGFRFQTTGEVIAL